jgi:hypothetical protein
VPNLVTRGTSDVVLQPLPARARRSAQGGHLRLYRVQAARRRALRGRQRPRCLIHVGSRRDWNLPRRLLWHSYGREPTPLTLVRLEARAEPPSAGQGRELPVQRDVEPNVLRLDPQLPRNCDLVSFLYQAASTESDCCLSTLTADFRRWLRYERPAGLLLSVIVFVVYKIALTFEE